MEEKIVRCHLCRHRCVIPEGKRGLCRVRENRGGVLCTLVYERLISRAADPIEKKPLFHFLPGSRAYSIATMGCNFRCINCQNYEISQVPNDARPIPGEKVSPEEVVEDVEKQKCESIAYTYSEPTIFFEYAFDIARLASREGIKNIFVTNGYITDEALEKIAPYLDAANIDLKGYSEDFYKKNCGAYLNEVTEAIKSYRRLGIWIEITTLIIPTLNDNPNELKSLAEFIYQLGPEIPWHVSRFYPMYRLEHLPQTSLQKLQEAREIGLKVGLRYVYEGNVPGEEGESTYCPLCGKTLVKRLGYQILENLIRESKCPSCGTTIDGLWE